MEMIKKCYQDIYERVAYLLEGLLVLYPHDNEHFLIGCIPRNFEETRSEKSVLELVKDIDRLSRHYLVRGSDTRESYILGNPVENLKYWSKYHKQRNGGPVLVDFSGHPERGDRSRSVGHRSQR